MGLILSLVTTLVSLVGQVTWKSLSVISIPGYVILMFADEILFGGKVYYPTFTGSVSFIFSLLLSFLFYFIIGSIVGWIYGKIKNKKLVPSA